MINSKQKIRLLRFINKHFPGETVNFQESSKVLITEVPAGENFIKFKPKLINVYECYISNCEFSDTKDFWSNEHNLRDILKLINEACLTRLKPDEKKKFKKFVLNPKDKNNPIKKYKPL